MVRTQRCRVGTPSAAAGFVPAVGRAVISRYGVFAAAAYPMQGQGGEAERTDRIQDAWDMAASNWTMVNGLGR